MRALGLDLGSRRIGVAISDSGRRLATPIQTIHRHRDHGADHAAVAALVEEWGAGVVVVGLPLSLDGTVGPAATAVLGEVDELARALTIPVETVDERLTTVTAAQQLRAGGRKARDHREVIDQTAAAVLLQAWLDRQETTPC